MLNSPMICLPSGWPAEAMMWPILCLSPVAGKELWISPKSGTQEGETLRLRMKVGSRGWVSFLCLLFSCVSWCHCSSHLEQQTGDCLVGAVVPHGTWSTWCNKVINTPPSSKHTPWMQSHTWIAFPRQISSFFCSAQRIPTLFQDTGHLLRNIGWLLQEATGASLCGCNHLSCVPSPHWGGDGDFRGWIR